MATKTQPRSNLKKKTTQAGPGLKRKTSFRGQDPEKLQDINEDYDDGDFEENLNINRPKDQIQLTPKELEEDMPSRTLVPRNPAGASNTAIYSYKDRVYRRFEPSEHVIIHFSLDGTIIHKGTPEASQQEDIEEERNLLIKEHKKTQQQADPTAPAEDLDAIKKQLRNKFYYSEHQVQTINEPIRERNGATEPPAIQRIAKEVTQWEIYDSNLEDIMKKNREENKNPASTQEAKADKTESSLYSSGFRRCLKVMERMTVLNAQNEKYKEYKYMWTQGDFLEHQKDGIIYPIWKFQGEKQKRKQVTSLCWNPRYTDLFAVGFGSYDFSKQKTGMICVYSLKNTTNPEYSFTTEAGVMSIDFHPKSPALLAVGLYDGTVMVFDIRSKYKKPIYQSTVRTNKHTDPVWQVMWNPDTSKNYNFYSISSDGRVTNWILMKNKLEPEDIIKLKLVGKTSDEEASLIGLAGGLCFDFSKHDSQVFLVGTEEGKIHQCSRAYSGQYQETYEGHLLSIYKVRFNNYHPRVFISASADWTAKVWDLKYKYPIMSFDLGIAVTDVQWAPYSSTVFAASTLDKAYVYDLQVDKYAKLAEIKPVKQPKLTNIAFNAQDPVLLIGDNHGGVTLTKLSPNLNRRGKYEKPDENKDKEKKDEKKPMDPKAKAKEEEKPVRTPEQIEFDKMEELMSMVGKFDKDDI